MACGLDVEPCFGTALLQDVASAFFLSLLSEFGDSGAEHLVVPVEHGQHALLQAECKPLVLGLEPSWEGKGLQSRLHCTRMGHRLVLCFQSSFSWAVQHGKSSLPWQSDPSPWLLVPG